MPVPHPTSSSVLPEQSSRRASSTYALRVGENTPYLGVKRPSSPSISMPLRVHSAALRAPSRLLRDTIRG